MICFKFLTKILTKNYFQDHPDLVKDQFWDEHYPELPYTVASEDTRLHNPIQGSTANVEVSFIGTTFYNQ